MIRMPDDVECRLRALLHIRQQTRMAKVGQNELEIPLIGFRKATSRHIERPSKSVHRKGLFFLFAFVRQHTVNFKSVKSIALQTFQMVSDKQR